MNAHHRRFEDVNVEYVDVPASTHRLHNYAVKHYEEDAMAVADSFIGVYTDWLLTLSTEELQAEYDLTHKRWAEAAEAENTNAFRAWSLLRDKVTEELANRRK